MRTIMNISLPASLAEMVKEEVKDNNYSSVSEFVRKLIREWHEEKVYKELKQSQEDMRNGKGILLKSVKDIR